MPLLLFLAQAFAISLSGVMAPGPIMAASAGKGAQSPHAGAWIAAGHGLVEFPLIAALFFGLGGALDMPLVRSLIGFAGGAFLIWMGVALVRNSRREIAVPGGTRHSPVLAGVFLSAGNPYFLLWWATVGSALIIKAAAFGPAGLVAFALVHWLADLGWNWFLSAAAFKGGRFFGLKFQKALFAAGGACLVLFGVYFVFDAVRYFL
jgi:threonine/homoserine/homoserine lactone efflux protein